MLMHTEFYSNISSVHILSSYPRNSSEEAKAEIFPLRIYFSSSFQKKKQNLLISHLMNNKEWKNILRQIKNKHIQKTQLEHNNLLKYTERSS